MVVLNSLSPLFVLNGELLFPSGLNGGPLLIPLVDEDPVGLPYPLQTSPNNPLFSKPLPTAMGEPLSTAKETPCIGYDVITLCACALVVTTDTGLGFVVVLDDGDDDDNDDAVDSALGL